MMFKLMMAMALMMVSGFSLEAAAKAKADDGDRSCLNFDSGESDETWPLFEKSVPECKRTMVTLTRDTKLDLGEKLESRTFKTGMTSFKAKVISGKGRYLEDDRAEDVTGATVWISVDRCEMRELVFVGANGKDVSSLKEARSVLTTDDLSGMANADELKGAKDDCSKK